jgi:hypothetical protein
MPGEPEPLVLAAFVTGRRLLEPAQKLNPWHSSIVIFAEVMLGQ